MNILVTGAWKCTKEQLNEIESMGNEIVFMQYEKDELPCEYSWVEAVICNGLFLKHPIEKFTNLKYIQLTSAGFDRMPLEYIKEKGIKYHNAKGTYSIPMAEYAVCGVLEIYRKSKFFFENQKQHKWEKNRNLLELNEKTVLIIGCGDVGKECAKRFKAFNSRVVGLNRSKVESTYFDKVYSLDDIDEVIGTADVVICSIALTDDTRHLLNEKRIRKLKESTVLVNVARGEIVDTLALEKYIDSIGGAVLDVFEEEPLSKDSSLWDKENVIITPHNSFAGDENGKRLSKVITNNLKRINT